MTVWPFRHVGLKVVSVVLAVLVWLMVAGEENVERGLRVPLEFQQFPADLELEGEPPTLVDVRVRGAASALARMSPGDVVAVLDLSAASPGRRLFPLTPEQVRVPFGVEVVQVQPSTVAMVFDRSRSGQVKVTPAWEGDPAPGFVVGKVSVDPESVDVVGPAGAVARTTEALAETVSVAGLRDTVTQSVTLGFLDPAVRLKSPRRASVTVEILPGPVERSVSNRPVHLRNLLAGLTAQAVPPTVRVVLRGSREGLARIVSDDVVAWVDLSGLGAGDYALTVRVDPSVHAGVASIDPQTVRVAIAGGGN
jgi:YbbR domain-containing protein